MSSTAFNYVTAEKAALYRAVMKAFAAAKAHFIVHLRPEEIIEQLILSAMTLKACGL